MKIKGHAGIEKATESLEKAIMEAYENSCPLSYPRKTGTPWWNRELERLKKCSRKLINRAQRAQTRGTANQAAAWELQLGSCILNPKGNTNMVFKEQRETAGHFFVRRRRTWQQSPSRQL